jgi:hypothetical protein
MTDAIKPGRIVFLCAACGANCSDHYFTRGMTHYCPECFEREPPYTESVYVKPKKDKP